MKLARNNNLVILGGHSGFGKELADLAVLDYDVHTFGKDDVDILSSTSVELFGKYLQEEQPRVFILNSYARTIKNADRANAQAKALQILWPFIKPLKTTMVVISSAITWSAPYTDDAVRLYQTSKQELTNFCLKNCWLDTSDESHKAKTILFEPATMTNRAEYAAARRTPLLSVPTSWYLIKSMIEANLPFVRIGAQGGTYVP